MGFVMRVVAALSLLTMCFAGEAKALPVIDFSVVSCQEFWETDVADRTSLLFWLYGYFQHKNNVAEFDMEKFGQQSQALALFCDREPGTNILTAANETFS
jgi:HdeA/HdeB family